MIKDFFRLFEEAGYHIVENRTQLLRRCRQDGQTLRRLPPGQYGYVLRPFDEQHGGAGQIYRSADAVGDDADGDRGAVQE